MSFEAQSIGGDFVIQKRDGMPTYNFAVVIDDHLMKISTCSAAMTMFLTRQSKWPSTKPWAGRYRNLATCP